MVKTFRTFGALFAATFIFLSGLGLLNTLLSTRMALEGFSTTLMGLVQSCYYTGLLTGAFVCHRLVQRIGHIRAFTALAATTTAAALLYGLYLSFWFWCLLRLASGVAAFGLFMIIESWLNECTEPCSRGRVFSIYMTLSYLGIAIGQQLLNFGDLQGPELFILAGVVFAVCLIPVSTTEGVHPRLPETQPTRFASLFRRAPLGMLGALTAGLTNSAFYAMMPAFCTAIGLSPGRLSWIMTLTVICGLAAQWAVGTLSDRFDRTRVLAVTATALTVVSALMFINGETPFWALATEMAVFGVLVFAVYPLSVARTHDIFGGREAVAVSAGLLFAYSIGACLSPLLASAFMTLLDSPFGLFAFWGASSGLFAVAGLFIKKFEKAPIVPLEQQVAFVPMKSTSPVIMAIDPRMDVECDER